MSPAIQAVQDNKATSKPSQVPTAIPLKWLIKKPICVKQWPLNEEKLQALEQLVEEQLDAHHIDESTSP